jgi:hypothetical protein
MVKRRGARGRPLRGPSRPIPTAADGPGAWWSARPLPESSWPSLNEVARLALAAAPQIQIGQIQIGRTSRRRSRGRAPPTRRHGAASFTEDLGSQTRWSVYETGTFPVATGIHLRVRWMPLDQAPRTSSRGSQRRQARPASREDLSIYIHATRYESGAARCANIERPLDLQSASTERKPCLTIVTSCPEPKFTG